ncbi:hypothetical protein ZIOFF_002197 [Zingiber officinale]|uniref:F-box domain-containing protein n=1 Tax=Zingiber officinale TaxID=94328 RepID=A0A8J5IB50_ZINOF|nr:hypothetical protein ZIOFF_002197 [Zingiber officinale]
MPIRHLRVVGGGESMAMLPDEIWAHILEIGTDSASLTYRDLCALAMASRRLSRLSAEPALWSTLLAIDFPDGEKVSPSPKALYQTRFKLEKAKRAALQRAKMLFAQSKVAVSRKRLQELKLSLVREGDRLKAAVEELRNLERARTASVALNVWQPEVVRGRQKQIVEQCTVPIESRVCALKMEVQVCKQQIANFNKTYEEEKKKLGKHKQALASLEYHPLQSHFNSTPSDSNKRKRLELSSDCKSLFLNV